MGLAELKDFYCWEFVIISQRWAKFMPDFISPFWNSNITSLITSNIKVSPTAITNVMREFILLNILHFCSARFTKLHSLFRNNWFTSHFMNEVFTQKPTILILNISIPSSPIRFIIHHAPFCWTDNITLH